MLHINEVTAGWDSYVLEVDGTWIFRFPRRSEVEEWLRKEIALLPELASWLPVRVPRFEFIGSGDTLFVGYRKIQGDNIDRCLVNAGRLDDLARRIGDFLAALHAFPPASAAQLRVPGGDLEVWRSTELDFVEVLAERVLPLIAAPTESQARALLEDWAGVVQRASFEPVLVHADLGPAHILCDESGVSGVIDWSDARLADPALDLAWLLNGTDARFAATLLARYCDLAVVDGGAGERARFYHLLGPWHEVLYGLDTKDDAFVRSGLAGVGTRLSEGW